MTTPKLSLLAISALGLAFTTSAQAGDAAAGYVLAKESCARCHNVEKGGGFKQRPPTFQSIAIYRREDDIWSRILAPSPHSGMPDVSWTLTPDQVQDLVAYIVSLDVTLTIPAQ